MQTRRVGKDLSGRVALVTGGTSGIGRSVSELLNTHGARVAINSRTSTKSGVSLAADLDDAIYVQADVGIADEVVTMVANVVNHFGRLDVVVNNAAIGTPNPIPHSQLDLVSDELWEQVLSVNLLGPWHVVKNAVPALRSSPDGVVINVSSLAGVRPTGSSIPYAVSKAALNHLTRLLANALGPQIRVNAVAPGLTETPWSSGWDSAKERYASRAPLKRIGTPRDAAEACLALILLTHVTGEVLVVDGGFQLC